MNKYKFPAWCHYRKYGFDNTNYADIWVTASSIKSAINLIKRRIASDDCNPSKVEIDWQDIVEVKGK